MSIIDIVLTQLLILLKKEVSDYSRHLQQYFQVFLAYAHKGAFEVSTTTLMNISIYPLINYIFVASTIIKIWSPCSVHSCSF